MPYLTSASEIRSLIAKYTHSKTLWIDTEVADYQSRNPRLSLIQILDNPNDLSGECTCILDVLEKTKLVNEFIEGIMLNPEIEKVFHNASYDLRFLGKKKAKNVTCTYQLAKKIPYYILPVPNYRLETLAVKLCNFQDIDKEQQSSEWGQRPLSEEQIEYAYLDCIYLAQVHLHLQQLIKQISPSPASEDLLSLGERYIQVEEQLKLLKSEYEHLQERMKSAMQEQNLSETAHLKLLNYERTTMKVQFQELVKFAENQAINLDFPISLTQKLQKDLGMNLEQLPLHIDKTSYFRLKPKNQDSQSADD
ncbi:MAG: ribonuclease D [Mastigocoleus sp. MO_167.B18]|uniref:ribonuclease D n=1 Tax=Mastigocoleus sp. MO_188.B34 TaxID=3036635 RepID=UPI002634F25A|nr:ribonuclease D [Mastigocoleus sp. MO_188.B34]MDJ0694374.1 ribonuclease D [Mastigocoleus sp. MO_188.B34]MDJ0772456.1 ribonuclease D [Mastigocoleus sp. MO_167.B18]